MITGASTLSMLFLRTLALAALTVGALECSAMAELPLCEPVAPACFPRAVQPWVASSRLNEVAAALVNEGVASSAEQIVCGQTVLIEGQPVELFAFADRLVTLLPGSTTVVGNIFSKWVPGLGEYDLATSTPELLSWDENGNSVIYGIEADATLTLRTNPKAPKEVCVTGKDTDWKMPKVPDTTCRATLPTCTLLGLDGDNMALKRARKLLGVGSEEVVVEAYSCGETVTLGDGSTLEFLQGVASDGVFQRTKQRSYEDWVSIEELRFVDEVAPEDGPCPQEEAVEVQVGDCDEWGAGEIIGGPNSEGDCQVEIEAHSYFDWFEDVQEFLVVASPGGKGHALLTSRRMMSGFSTSFVLAPAGESSFWLALQHWSAGAQSCVFELYEVSKSGFELRDETDWHDSYGKCRVLREENELILEGIDGEETVRFGIADGKLVKRP